MDGIGEALSAIGDPRQLAEGLFLHLPVALQIYDARGHCVLTNAAFGELFGSVPPPSFNVFEDGILAGLGLSDHVRRAFAGETVTLAPLWYDPREHGLPGVPRARRVAVGATLFPLHDAAGRVAYVAIVFKDVTAETLARERAEELARRAEESRALFETVLSAAPVGICFLDHDLRFRLVNEALAALNQLSIEGHLGRSLGDVLGGVAPMLEPAFRDVVDGGSAVRHVEARAEIPAGSGRYHYGRGTIYPLRIGGEVAGVGCIVEDVTERRLLEQRRAAQYEVTRLLADAPSLAAVSERLLAALCRTLGWEVGAVWRRDEAAGGLRAIAAVDVTGAHARFVAATRAVTLPAGRGVPGRVEAEVRAAWLVEAREEYVPARAAAARASGLRSGCAFPVTVDNHVEAVIELCGRDLRARDDDLLHLLATIGSQLGQFVRRRQIERQIADRERRHRAILDSALDAIITIDHRGHVVEFNPAAERIFGRRRDHVVGQDAALLVPPRLRRRFSRELLRSLARERGPTPRLRQLPALRGDGTEFPAEVAIAPVRGSDPPLLTGHIRDITSRRRALAELQKSEERYRRIVETAGEGIVVLDGQGAITWLNRQLAELLGRPARALAGAPLSELLREGDEALRRWYAELGAGRPVQATVQPRREGGDERWLLVNATPIRDRRGQLTGVLAMVTDITDRHRSAEALRQAEERRRLAAVLEQMPSGVILVDAPSSRVWFANDMAARILGRARHDAGAALEGGALTLYDGAGQPFDPGDAPLGRALAGEIVTGADCRARRPDGSWAALRLNAAPVRGLDGRVGSVVLAFDDVAELKRVEEAERVLLAATTAAGGSLDQTRMLAEAARAVVAGFADRCALDLVTEDGALQHLATMAGAREPPVPTTLLHPCAAGARVLSEGAARLSAEGRLSVMRVPLRGRERLLGVLTLASNAARRRYDARDLALAEEVARRLAVALENARLYESARRAIETRDSVLAVVTHDLRNPLSSILLNVSLLQETAGYAATPGPWQHAAEHIRRAARRMERLLHDLVDLASIQAGHLALELRPYDVAGVVRDAVELMEPLAREKGLALAGEAEPLVVACDRDRVIQALGNLVGNAIKVTNAPGTIAVSARRDDGAVRFAVRDTGPGIPADELPRLFEPYWRGKQPGYKGTGLGLAIVKGIVASHGGRVWIESELGRGTTVHFTLPAE